LSLKTKSSHQSLNNLSYVPEIAKKKFHVKRGIVNKKAVDVFFDTMIAAHTFIAQKCNQLCVLSLYTLEHY